MNLIKEFIEQSSDLKLIHIHGNNHSCVDKNTDPNIVELTFTHIEKIKFEQKITEKRYPIEELDYKNIHRNNDFVLRFEDDLKKP